MWWQLACSQPEPPPPALVPEQVWVEFDDEGTRFVAYCRSDPTIDAEPEWLVDGAPGTPDELECRTAVACSLGGRLSEAYRPDEQFDAVLRARAIEDALLCEVTCGTHADAAFDIGWDGRPGALLWPQARAEQNTCQAEGPVTVEIVVEAGPASAIEEIELHGPGGDFGFALGHGDVDGDGARDLAIGAPKAGEMTYAGQLFVLSGLELGVPTVEVTEPVFEGGAVAAYVGWSVAASDLDDDGLDELLVGAPGSGELAHRGGAAHLLSGGEVSESWYGPVTYGWGAVDVAATSEVLIAGAYGVEDNAGAAYSLLSSGLDEAFVNGDVATGYLGLAVAFAGDTDGDGLDEWAAGAPGADAVALVEEEDIDWLFGPAGSYFGWDVAGVGDFDGDGLDDVLVAAPLADQAWVGDRSIDIDARSVAGHGDQDGDGHTELLLGEPGQGTVWMVHDDGTLVSLQKGENFGWSVLSVPDLDGDGLDEILVGALDDDDGPQPSILWMSPQD